MKAYLYCFTAYKQETTKQFIQKNKQNIKENYFTTLNIRIIEICLLEIDEYFQGYMLF
jgi:hypothetical protein